MSLRCSCGVVGMLALVIAGPAAAQPAEPTVPPTEPTAPPAENDAEREAKERFFRGLELFQEQQWGPALAEFDRSRALFPTRAATRNAAICLKHLGRQDEALTLYELWISSYADAPEDERALVQREVEALEKLVGTLEVSVGEAGATVLVNGEERGVTPLARALRVVSGTHLVQVYKEGYVTGSARVNVAGAASERVAVELRPIAQSGRLRVKEATGRDAEVLVDGIRVGTAPWEGAVPFGDHHVELRAPGDLGSQPVAAPVALGEVTSMTLALEPLPAGLVITTLPAGALIAVDGVSVGRGTFRGRLRLGWHRVEVGLEGYVPVTREVTFEKAEQRSITIELERDRTSPIWSAPEQPRFAVGVSVGPAIGPGFFGDVSANGCDDACTLSPSYGGLGLVTLGYRFPIGVTLGVDAGYLGLVQQIDERAVSLVERPDALRRDPGRVEDVVALQGLLVGPSLSVDGGDAWRWRARLFAGLFAANAGVTREGRFDPAGGGVPYATGAYGEDHRALSVGVIPQVQLGRRVAEGVELSVALAPILVVGLEPPVWSNDQDVLGSDFLGYYEEESLVGDATFALAPSFAFGGLF